MKKINLTIGILLFSTILFSSCGSDKKTPEHIPSKIVNEQFECPMNCTEEIFEKPRKCPVCEMDLVQLSNG